MTRNVTITNLTQHTILASSVAVADTPSTRRIGLLNHTHLNPGDGLFITHGRQIHTNGMKFPIDVIFIRQRWPVGFETVKGATVSRVVMGVGPGRVEGCDAANSVLELPEGVIEASGTRAGDVLRVEYS